jgi:hypothetical protein
MAAMVEGDAKLAKVSVVIPTYNRAKLLSHCVQSVLGQTHRNIEAIVIDDGSEDETAPLLASWAKADPRLKVILQHHKGAQAARNLGFQASSGEFVSFMDDDDLWHPEKVAAQLAAFESKVDGVICQTVWFKEWPGDHNFLFNVIDERDFLARFLALDVVWQTSAPLWRRALVERVGQWDERLTSGQDLDFHTRCLCLEPELLVLPRVLNFFREHTGRRITKDREEEHAANSFIAMRTAYEIMVARKNLTPERGAAIASTLMRQSRTLALNGQTQMVEDCMRIALAAHPSAATRAALKTYLWPLNRTILAMHKARPIARGLRKGAQLTMYALRLETKRPEWWQQYPYEDKRDVESWKSIWESK